jgi:hypothetical protein
VAGTAALMLAVSVALDFHDDAALCTVVYCCGVALLQVPVAAVYVLARLVLAAAGTPLPSTIAGVLMAGAYAAGLPAAYGMTTRRLRAERR